MADGNTVDLMLWSVLTGCAVAGSAIVAIAGVAPAGAGTRHVTSRGIRDAEEHRAGAARDQTANSSAPVKWGSKISEDEARYMRRRISETKAEFFSAKARMTVFGNREVNIFLAGVERRGGFTGNDVIARQLTTQAIQSLREQFGFKKKKTFLIEISRLFYSALHRRSETVHLPLDCGGGRRTSSNRV